MENKAMDSQSLITNFCSRFDIKPLVLPQAQVGYYDVVDADQKDLGEAFGKIWRKLSEEKFDASYLHGHEAEAFNLLRDYARCGILMNNYTEAPAIISAMMQRLGGQVSVHNRDTYKAFHLHTQLAGINCEIQFHTYETYALKQATEVSYQKWRKAKAEDEAAVLANPDYIEENRVMRPLCQAIYDRSGFNQALPEIEKLRTANQVIPPMIYRNIGVIYRNATQAQAELLTIVKERLQDLSLNKLRLTNEPNLTQPEIDALLSGLATINLFNAQDLVTDTAPDLDALTPVTAATSNEIDNERL